MLKLHHSTVVIVWTLKAKKWVYMEKNGRKLVLVSFEAQFFVEQHIQSPPKSTLGKKFESYLKCWPIFCIDSVKNIDGQASHAY